VQILRDAVTRGVGGLAIAPMKADSVVGVIADAAKMAFRIPVIILDSDSPNSPRICYVGTDKRCGKRSRQSLQASSSPFPCDDDAVKGVQIIQDILNLTRYPNVDGIFLSGGGPCSLM
jgi:ABC-type sugar transport system substrate-binding protein